MRNLINLVENTANQFTAFRLMRSNTHPAKVGIWFASTPQAASVFAKQAASRDAATRALIVTTKIELGNVKKYNTYADFLADYRAAGSDASKLRRALMRQGFNSIEITNSDTDGAGQRTDWAVFESWQAKIIEVKPVSKEVAVQEDASGVSAFDRWYAGSKLVDAQGKPIKLYHGTSKDKDFKAFNMPRNGVWFTTSPEEASKYAVENDSMDLKYDYDTRTYRNTNTAARVIPAYVRATNPVYMDKWPDELNYATNYKKAQGNYFDILRSKGHDSIIFTYEGGKIVVALSSPSQIKSAIGNNGNFDPNKKNIHEDDNL